MRIFAGADGRRGKFEQRAPFTSCDYTRTSCVARGMFSTDASSNVTARFGGLEFVPAQILVRSFGRAGTQLSAVQDNLALYNDFVPLVYGTAWYQPPIVFARNDGNLTHMEVLLGMGTIDSVITVLVNDIADSAGAERRQHDGHGLVQLVTPGTRNGAFDHGFHGRVGESAGRSVRQHGE
jgi:hypothetical protein